jgi:hypothetical protein
VLVVEAVGAAGIDGAGLVQGRQQRGRAAEAAGRRRGRVAGGRMGEANAKARGVAAGALKVRRSRGRALQAVGGAVLVIVADGGRRPLSRLLGRGQASRRLAVALVHA